MIENEQQLKNRFNELAQRSFNKGIWVYSDFLTVAEQSVLLTMKLACGVTLLGGYEGAERRMACFGREEDCGYEPCPDFVCIRIEPVSQKFADELTHRDFFGSVMGLGLKREVLGDIIVFENCGYLFAHTTVSEYICENLTSVKHTTVRCCPVLSPPVESVALPPVSEVVVASERLDALIAAVYGLSRSVCKEITEQGKVSVNSVIRLNAGLTLNEHDTVSVRGCGRFIFEGVLRQTKKGRQRAAVRIYK